MLVDGIALAATIARDRAGAAARDGLAPALGEAVAVRLAALEAGGRSALRTVAESVLPAIDPRAALPPRAAALLATDVPRDTGARWIAGAPPPRARFRAPPSLRAQLRRLAGAPASSGHDDADRGAGRRVLGTAIRAEHELPEGDRVRARALAALDPEESAAVLALEPMLEGGDAEHARALVRAALAAGAGSALTRALGAIERGARDPGARGRWERAGRELAAEWERGCRG